MRRFDYSIVPQALLSPEVMNLLIAIHEYRGKQTWYLTAQKDILETLLQVAVIQSTDASNRIEGIFTSEARLKELVAQTAQPINRNEAEIAGYRNVLTLIHEHYDAIPIRANTILQLHRDLYSFQADGMGGVWKNVDNVITETDASSVQRIRFKPTSAFETPAAVETLCDAYHTALASSSYDPLLLTLCFIFDFLCIHPFNDGNGRMSRLLTLLLLYQHGYLVGKYISLEKVIEQTKTSYYEALRACSWGWEDGKNDLAAFVKYMLSVILKAYREFEGRVECVVTSKLTKSERIREIFNSHLGKIRKSNICHYCPDISVSLIERILNEMLTKGEIQKVGSGRSTAYVKQDNR